MAKRIFKDSAIAPIIAWDFDGTINVDGEDIYPQCGTVRKYAKEVINLLHDIGVKNVIWTSRDVAYNQDEMKIYDHLTPMIDFLGNNDIKYDAINKSIQFAPYAYNGRKVYAHMYVDDRAFGWNEYDLIMLDVLRNILDMIGIDTYSIHGRYIYQEVRAMIICDEEPDEEIIDGLKLAVKYWKD